MLGVNENLVCTFDIRWNGKVKFQGQLSGRLKWNRFDTDYKMNELFSPAGLAS